MNYPNQYGASCGFNLKAINYLSKEFIVTLPALNQTLFRNAAILQAQAFKDTICLGDSVQLSAYGAGAERFRWQIANGLSAPSDTMANPFVKPTVTITYMVIGSSVFDQDTAFVKVTVLPKPGGVTLSGPASVCPNVQGVWYRAANAQRQRLVWGLNGGTILTNAGDSISVNWGNANAAAGVWVVPENYLGCPGDTVFFPVRVNVVLATQTPLGPDTLCQASASGIRYSVAPATGSVYTWGIQGGSITAGQGTAAARVNWTKLGTGKLWVQEESRTSTSHCFGVSDTLLVRTNPSPAGTASIYGPKQVFTFAEDQVYRVLNPEPGSVFDWQVTGGQIVAGHGTGSIAVNWDAAGEGIILLTETNQQGCSGNQARLSVEISGAPEPVFYNIFTPNNDNQNDAFVVRNLKWYAENELIIYNRWGTEVFRKRNYRNDWKATELSSGIYYYYFKAGGKSWKGWVEVLK
ncbi:T9SS type B sorting domain-containing protein [Adhaeribacter soli]|uniref:T9SS type B sorting domain-containing protein n=1 Tax=Adhaeribacter soli TaxID=2607655 RepID=UPI0017826AE6|nr:gliding motility-associated C-terminal domain-containing protein [Adhaeribacter soli]